MNEKNTEINDIKAAAENCGNTVESDAATAENHGLSRALLFYNPTAGNGMFKSNLDYIVNRFQEKGMVLVTVRARSGIVIDDVIRYIEKEGFCRIIAAGGDGTINIVVNSMMRHNCHIPLAVFPAGTANDYANYFSIPTDLDGMIDVALGDNYVRADIGRYNDKYFVNVLSMGSVIDVSHKTDSTLKNSLGMLAYYMKALSELPALKPMAITVDATDADGNDLHLEENTLFMLVLNGTSAGGFRKMSLDSSISDGLLDVIIFKEVKLTDIPAVAFSVLQGTHKDNENVIAFQTPHLTISSDEDINTDADGELGEKLPLDVEIVPGRLLVCAPADE